MAFSRLPETQHNSERTDNDAPPATRNLHRAQLAIRTASCMPIVCCLSVYFFLYVVGSIIWLYVSVACEAKYGAQENTAKELGCAAEMLSTKCIGAALKGFPSVMRPDLTNCNATIASRAENDGENAYNSSVRDSWLGLALITFSASVGLFALNRCLRRRQQQRLERERLLEDIQELSMRVDNLGRQP